MAEITDADGVRWKVYRRWGCRYWNAVGVSGGEVEVSGWRNSERCIQELAESAFAGTLDQEIVEPSGTGPPPEMNLAPESWSNLPLESKVTLWRMYNSGGLHR